MKYILLRVTTLFLTAYKDPLTKDKQDIISTKDSIPERVQMHNNDVIENCTDAKSDSPLWYPTNTKTPYKLIRTTNKHPFTSDNIYAYKCNTNTTKEYYDTMLKPFKDTHIQTYRFINDATSGTLYISITPNSAHYDSIDAFKNDFDMCRDNVQYKPYMLNNEYIMFISMCQENSYQNLKDELLPYIKLQKNVSIPY